MESKSCIFGKCIRKLGDVFVSRIFPQVWNFIFLFQEYFLMFEILLTSGRWETTLFQIVLFTEKLALSSMECQRLSDMQITPRGLGGAADIWAGSFLDKLHFMLLSPVTIICQFRAFLTEFGQMWTHLCWKCHRFHFEKGQSATPLDRDVNIISLAIILMGFC